MELPTNTPKHLTHVPVPTAEKPTLLQHQFPTKPKLIPLAFRNEHHPHPHQTSTKLPTHNQQSKPTISLKSTYTSPHHYNNTKYQDPNPTAQSNKPYILALKKTQKKKHQDITLQKNSCTKKPTTDQRTGSNTNQQNLYQPTFQLIPIHLQKQIPPTNTTLIKPLPPKTNPDHTQQEHVHRPTTDLQPNNQIPQPNTTSTHNTQPIQLHPLPQNQ